MLSLFDVKPTDIGFTWTKDDGTVHCWLTERMEKHAKLTGMKVFSVNIDYGYAKFARKHCGIERHRLDRITPQVIAQNPLIYVALEDGSHKLVDGNHRYCRAAALGWRSVPAYIFEIEEHLKFKVDIPPSLYDEAVRHQQMFSGIA